MHILYSLFLRSELMELYRLIIPKDDAWKLVDALGNTDAAHFIDLNKNEQPFNLPYQQRLKVCDEAERRVLYLISKCREYRIKLFKPKSIEVFEAKVAQLSEDMHKADHLLFDAIEQDVADKEAFVAQMAKQIDDMQNDINKMDDFKRVLDFVREMLPFINNLVPKGKQASSINDDQRLNQLSEYLIDERDRFDEIQFVAGTIR